MIVCLVGSIALAVLSLLVSAVLLYHPYSRLVSSLPQRLAIPPDILPERLPKLLFPKLKLSFQGALPGGGLRRSV